MSVLAFPDHIDRLKTAIAAQWRRDLFSAGMKVPEAEMQHVLDLLVPGVCEYFQSKGSFE